MTSSDAPLPAFSRSEVDTALEEFRARATALGSVRPERWADAVGDLVIFCRDDPVARFALASLLQADVDAKAWWDKRRTATPSGVMGGSEGSLELPTDRERKAALALHFLALVHDTPIGHHPVGIHIAGLAVNNYSWRLRQVYGHLVEPLKRYGERRIGNLRPELPPLPPPFINTGSIITAGVDIKNSTIATGNAQVSQSVSTYTATTDDGRAIQSLSALLGAVETDRHTEVLAAIDALARAVDSGQGNPGQLARAAQTLVTSSPTKMERLKVMLSAALVAAAAKGLEQAAGAGASVAAGYAAAHLPMVWRAISLVTGGGAQ